MHGETVCTEYRKYVSKISVSHVAITALLMSQNGLRSNLRASNFEKFPEGA